MQPGEHPGEFNLPDRTGDKREREREIDRDAGRRALFSVCP